MNRLAILGLLAVFMVVVTGATCPVKDDIVTDLKNFDRKFTFPCMYSGFVTVDEPTDSNLFYWFYRDEKLDENAPLVLWINGGPGSSSMFGNLIENGPFRLVRDATGKINVHSLTGQAWNAVANVVYLDQPVGVGYSYGHLKITEMSQIQENTIAFIKGFYGKHPEMKGRNFFISGESYGGKYEPAMATGIIDYNRNHPDDQIPLKGVLIGNGFVDPIVQRLSIRHLSLALGSIQFDSIPELDTMEQRCHQANGRKDIRAPDVCGDVSDFVSTMDGGMDMYDSRWLSSNATRQEEAATEYLNYPDVISQLHVGSSTKSVKFALGNETIYENFIGDGMIRYIDEHQKILDNNITLLIFVGQFDRKDGPYGVQEWMKKLKWEGMKDFHAGSRNLYYYVSDDNNEIRLGGNYKQHKNLNVLMIYAAGHLVPSTQLALSRNMLSDIMFKDGLQCHEENKQCNLDLKTCKLMKYCNSNGKCITGKCICEPGYFGADCSITASKLGSASMTLNATQWVYYKLANADDSTKITATSSKGEFKIYTRRENVPSQSFYNWYMEGSNLELVANRNTSGEYIAFFNPDLENKIDLKLTVSSESSMWTLIFWLCLGIGAVLAVLSVVNFMYFFKMRKAKHSHSPRLIETVSESA